MKEGLNIAYLNGAKGYKKIVLGSQGSEGGSTGGDSKPKWTGHADVEGLKAIGWTDEDIAYYQENGVNWNAEDDEYHKVPEDNIALYGVLTINNISTYKDRIVYLPKIDTSGVTSLYNKFNGCYSLVFIPLLDTKNVTDMSYMFSSCYSLVSIPLLDTQKVTDMSYMFGSCYSLISIPLLDTQNVTSMSGMFGNCYSLVSIPLLDTQKVTSFNSMFSRCYSLVSIPLLDTQKVTDMSYMFGSCYSLRITNLKGLKKSIEILLTSLLEKDSLLYIINNEASTSAITITLSSYCYAKHSTDADIVAALANHPNISLAQ